MVPEPLHSLFSLCVRAHYIYKKGNVYEMGQITRKLCFSLQVFGGPSYALPDSAEINKNCSFHTTQPLNESQLHLVMFF